MYKNKTFLAIIPARGGSKRLPRKNVLDLVGKPLIAWSIESALKSKYIDEVMVSTDDNEIETIAKRHSANVPYKRASELSNDVVGKEVVIEDVINYYAKNLNKNFDYIIYLQPTSPLRTSEDIDNSIEFLFEKNADAIVSVCEVEHPVQWSGTLDENMDMSQFLDADGFKYRSQDLEKYYRLNGSIFLSDTKRFLEEKSMFLKSNIFAFEMSQEKSVDIDTELDFKIAKVLIEDVL